MPSLPDYGILYWFGMDIKKLNPALRSYVEMKGDDSTNESN